MDIYNWKDLSLYPSTSSVFGADSIGQAIYNMLSISKGEFLFNPEFGCSLEDLLFQPMDDVTEDLIIEHLIQCLQRWDPRISVNPARTTVVGNYDNNTYEIMLVIRVSQTQGENPEFSYSFTVHRPI